MSTKIEIEVTQEHIEKGELGEPTMCPIAHAMSDAGYYHVYIDRHDVHYSTSDNCSDDERQATTDHAIRTWQERYDAGQEVKPFSLLLTQNYPLTRADEMDMII